MDEFTRTETVGLGGNIGKSIKNFFFGIVMVIGAIIFLLWNEYNHAGMQSALTEMRQELVVLKEPKADPALDGKPQAVTGEIVPLKKATDTEFDIQSDGFVLHRHVRMYQWEEEEHKQTENQTGGSTKTTYTYTYKKGWHDEPIDSSWFKERTGHENPPMRFRSSVFTEEAKMGELIIPHQTASKIKATATLILDSNRSYPHQARLHKDNVLYIGEDPGRPKIGDMQISYTYAPKAGYTLLATQKEGNVVPFVSNNDRRLFFYRESTVISPQVLLDEETDKHNNQTWALRGIGLLIMFTGFMMIFSILQAITNIIPIFGTATNTVLSLVSLVLTLLLGGTTIVVGWLGMRPWILLGVAAVIGGGIYWLLQRAKKRQPPQTTASNSAATPPPRRQISDTDTGETSS